MLETSISKKLHFTLTQISCYERVKTDEFTITTSHRENFPQVPAIDNSNFACSLLVSNARRKVISVTGNVKSQVENLLSTERHAENRRISQCLGNSNFANFSKSVRFEKKRVSLQIQ